MATIYVQPRVKNIPLTGRECTLDKMMEYLEAIEVSDEELSKADPKLYIESIRDQSKSFNTDQEKAEYILSFLKYCQVSTPNTVLFRDILICIAEELPYC